MLSTELSYLCHCLVGPPS